MASKILSMLYSSGLLDARALLVFLIALLSAAYILRRLSLKNLPPGPWGLPLIGASFRLGTNPGRSMLKMSEKYGKIFSIRLGQKLTVVISDAKLAREVFVKNADTTSGRIRYGAGNYSKGSVVTADGPEVKYLRRVVLRALRDVGIGKTKVAEKLIGEEADILCRNFAEKNGTPFEPKELVGLAVANIISTLCFSKRFDYSDPEFQNLVTCLKIVTSVGSQSSAGTYLAMFLRYTPIARRAINSMSKLRGMVTKIVEEHKTNFDVNDVRDVIDVLLEELKKPEGIYEGSIEEGNIWRTVFEMFSAGTDTTANTLSWSILYLALNRDVQNKVRSEIIDQIGLERTPSFSDRLKLPYTNATLTEVLRIAHPVPLGVGHRTTAPTQLCGYDIPEDTTILNSQWAMSRDPITWQDPYEFKPSRFLSKNGKTFQAPSGEFIPFGIGPRACLGELLANIELFIFFTSMMQRFTFELPPNEPPPSLEGTTGSTYVSQDYRIRAIPNTA